MAGYNPYEPMQPTAEDRAWEARYNKWLEEENARNALEDAARLRAGEKLPGTWTPESQRLFTNPGMGFFHPNEKGDPNTEQRDYQPPEAGYYDRAKALIDQQNRNPGIPSTAQGPSTPVPFDLNESTWQPTPATADALSMVNMIPTHTNAPVGPEMVPAHTPGSPYRETILRNPTGFDKYMHGVTFEPGIEDQFGDILAATAPIAGKIVGGVAKAGVPAVRGGSAMEGGTWFPRKFGPAQLEGETGVVPNYGPSFDMPNRMVNPRWNPQQTYRYHPPAQLGETPNLLPYTPEAAIPGRGSQGLLSGQRPQWSDLIDFLVSGKGEQPARAATKALPAPQGKLPMPDFTLSQLLDVLRRLGAGAQ